MHSRHSPAARASHHPVQFVSHRTAPNSYQQQQYSTTPRDDATAKTDVKCKDGEYLSVDSNVQNSTCVACPAGSYSLGKSTHFDKWDVVPIQFQTSCSGTGCQEWQPHGSYIDSGNNRGVDSSKTTLALSFLMPTNGTVTISYRCSCQEKDRFHMLLDSAEFKQASGYDAQWKEATTTVSEGYHTLSLVYDKDYSGDSYDDRVYVRSVTISEDTGVVLECTKCPPGSAQPATGATGCETCGAGTFAATEGIAECEACPAGYNSYAGAAACYEMKKCAAEDYTYLFGECNETSGTRTKSFVLTQPSLCNSEGVEPPADEEVPCEQAQCRPGQQPSTSGGCEPCPSGTVSADGTACVTCGLGERSEHKTLYFDEWVTLPEGWSTYCEGQCSTAFVASSTIINSFCSLWSDTQVWIAVGGERQARLWTRARGTATTRRLCSTTSSRPRTRAQRSRTPRR